MHPPGITRHGRGAADCGAGDKFRCRVHQARRETAAQRDTKVTLEPAQLADRLNFGVPVGPSIGLD